MNVDKYVHQCYPVDHEKPHFNAGRDVNYEDTSDVNKR